MKYIGKMAETESLLSTCCTQSAKRQIIVYNRSAISVNRRDVSYQFLSSFSRLFVQEYETDCCLRNRTVKWYIKTHSLYTNLLLTLLLIA
jgi:hypothetical protein